MKRILAVTLLVFLIGYAVWTAISPKEPREGLAKGNAAPNFELQTLSGETVQLADYQGKKVLLNFWATWCGPCRAEMPDMQKLYDKYEGNVVVLAVNLTNTEKSVESVDAFVKELNLSFPIAIDEEGAINTKYEVLSYPTSYILDEEGRIQTKFAGAMSYETMESLVKK
ncbi:TlpA family protein disulfide reductase [Metabacillus herbersteinensis]|uniref:TlpA family protein disulfide reductase n=1 Tax=Metabacillus herbersteinensis TaxID=283816 RepID=A0ABV6GK64_9BACI